MAEATKAPAGAPISPAPKPTWTEADSRALLALTRKRELFLTHAVVTTTVAELRKAMLGAESGWDIVYEDWSDGGDVYVTKVTIDVDHKQVRLL